MARERFRRLPFRTICFRFATPSIGATISLTTDRRRPSPSDRSYHRQMKRLSRELIASLASGAVVALYSILAFDGAGASYRLWYYSPAGMAAASLLVDRIRNRHVGTVSRHFIDAVVTILCLSRPLAGWPPASGHAIFFIHALLTGNSLTTRVLALILGAVTLYAKIWLWNWDTTLWPGLFLGLLSAFLWNRAGSRQAR